MRKLYSESQIKKIAEKGSRASIAAANQAAFTLGSKISNYNYYNDGIYAIKEDGDFVKVDNPLLTDDAGTSSNAILYKDADLTTTASSYFKFIALGASSETRAYEGGAYPPWGGDKTWYAGYNYRIPCIKGGTSAKLPMLIDSYTDSATSTEVKINYAVALPSTVKVVDKDYGKISIEVDIYDTDGVKHVGYVNLVNQYYYGQEGKEAADKNLPF